MVEPTVSMIVPNYNYSHYVDQALESLLEQSLRSLEVIAIDDASTDDSVEHIRHYTTDPRVRMITHQTNCGHIATYNEGISLARGAYIGLLSADDYCLDSRTLDRQVELFTSSKRIGLVYSAHILVEENGHTMTAIPWANDRVACGLDEFRTLMWSNYIPASGTLLRRTVHDGVGLYDAHLPHAADWDLWLRTVAHHDAGYISQPLWAYRQHERNMNHRYVSPVQATRELIVVLQKAFASLPKDAPNDIRASRRAVFRHALLQSAWVDLYYGRYGRAWRGVGYALGHRPGIALSREGAGLLRHLILNGTVRRGRLRMQKLARLLTPSANQRRDS
ncbi:MAG: glycosyltransferase [Chloroflexi bacterium]|nr:glycosyltransferase [Chloroflexota bacterium]